MPSEKLVKKIGNLFIWHQGSHAGCLTSLAHKFFTDMHVFHHNYDTIDFL
jgi:hypothetical protein